MKYIQFMRLSFISLGFFLAACTLFPKDVQQVNVELKYVEIDDSDYDVVKAELEAGKLRREFEGLKLSEVTPDFWGKVQSFPGADILSAPRITVLVNQEAVIQVGEEHVFPGDFQEDGEPTDFQKRFVGIKVQVAPTLKKRGIGLSIKTTFTKLMKHIEVPNVPDATLPVFNSKQVQTNVILPDAVPAMIGGFSSDGRRTLIICTARLVKDADKD